MRFILLGILIFASTAQAKVNAHCNKLLTELQKPGMFRHSSRYPVAYFLTPRSNASELIERVNFVFERLNDPKAFTEFVGEILSVVGSPSGREKIMTELTRRLLEEGFTIEVAEQHMPPGIFLAAIREGIIHDDIGLLGYSVGRRHGRDSHIVQIAYSAHEFAKQYPEENFLDFYKFLGDEPHFWESLFELEYASHLGNPSIIKKILGPILKLE